MLPIPSPQNAPILAPIRAEHEQMIRRALLHRKSARTLREYDKAWSYFQSWCKENDYIALPAEPLTVAAYLAACAQGFTDKAKRKHKPAKLATLRQWSAAIGYKHRAAQYEDPTRAEGCKETLEGLAREYGTAQEKKEPITREELEQMILHTPDDLRGARDRALLLVGFSAALRRSELVALEMRDVTFSGGYARLTLRQSKTDQDKQGESIALPMDTNARLNPVAALVEWIERAEITEGKLFRKIDRWGKPWARGLTPGRVAETVKHYADLAGIDPERVSGHSLRAGFITSAARAGRTGEQIATVSRHKRMDTLQGYVRDAGKMQSDVVRAVLESI